MTDWEYRMSLRHAHRVPTEIHCVPPDDLDDTHPREWCTNCGRPNPPPQGDAPYYNKPPCPACGSTWRWFGRAADALGTGTATEPPPFKCYDCFVWKRHYGGQEHFGWGWWLICGHCAHGCHDGELWS